MTTKTHPTDVLEQCKAAATSWAQFGEEQSLGNMGLETFTTHITEAEAIIAQINSLETQLVNLRNQREEKLADLWDRLKRVRNGVKAFYGDDSSEYEMVGGTRTSERKSPVRRAKPSA